MTPFNAKSLRYAQRQRRAALRSRIGQSLPSSQTSRKERRELKAARRSAEREANRRLPKPLPPPTLNAIPPPVAESIPRRHRNALSVSALAAIAILAAPARGAHRS